MSLRNRLSILVGLALLPPIGLLAYDTYDTRRRERVELLNEAHQRAQLIAGQLETIIQGARRLSWALSHQTRIVRSEPDRCAEHLRTLVDDVPLYRAGIVTDRTGKVVCSWPKAEGATLGDRDYIRQALASNDLIVGPLILKGRITGESALPLARRLASDADSGGVIVLGLDLDLLAKNFQQRYDWKNRYLSVLDREGTIILRVPGHAEALGKKVSPEGRSRTELAPSGSFEWRDTFGRRAIIGFAKVEGLLVSVGYHSDSVDDQLNTALWRNAALMAVALALALTAAWIAGERLLRKPIKRLVKAARRHEAGERQVRFPPLDPKTELGSLSRALNRMVEANESLLGQREILMRELQHRVMNSLQLLASFLQLQARNADPATREQLAVARQRIVSMSTIFRYLYRADLAKTVEFGAFLDSFCHDTARAYLGPNAPTLTVEADTLEIPLEQALSLALMTHELITNALKHAFPAGAPGNIRIAFKVRPGGAFTLTVADDGMGMPAEFDLSASKSLGMILIDRLTQSLQGKVDIQRGAPGTTIVISIPPSDTDSGGRAP